MKQILTIILIVFTFVSIDISQAEVNKKDLRADNLAGYGLILEPVYYKKDGKKHKGLICVIMVSESSDESSPPTDKWFLIESDSYYNKYLGKSLAEMSIISQVKASKDSQYLAIVSVAEGHPILQVIDLQKLINKRKVKTLKLIDPYPGYLYIEKWRGNRLIVESNMLLTHRKGELNRVNSALMLSTEEKFIYDIEVNRFIPINPELKKPVRYFSKLLFNKDIYMRWQGLDALKALNSFSALPYIKKAYKKEKNLELKRAMKKIYRKFLKRKRKSEE